MTAAVAFRASADQRNSTLTKFNVANKASGCKRKSRIEHLSNHTLSTTVKATSPNRVSLRSLAAATVGNLVTRHKTTVDFAVKAILTRSDGLLARVADKTVLWARIGLDVAGEKNGNPRDELRLTSPGMEKPEILDDATERPPEPKARRGRAPLCGILC